MTAGGKRRYKALRATPVTKAAPAKTSETLRSRDRIQEHRAMMQESLAAGAAAMAQAITNARKPTAGTGQQGTTAARRRKQPGG